MNIQTTEEKEHNITVARFFAKYLFGFISLYLMLYFSGLTLLVGCRVSK